MKFGVTNGVHWQFLHLHDLITFEVERDHHDKWCQVWDQFDSVVA